MTMVLSCNPDYLSSYRASRIEILSLSGDLVEKNSFEILLYFVKIYKNGQTLSISG
jgi:hypothetical protein